MASSVEGFIKYIRICIETGRGWIYEWMDRQHDYNNPSAF